jgi:arylsulfatase
MPSKKPNILILWGDDIGWYNISHNNRGAMGYQTPNIDRVAREGIEFTDFYAQQSCTAGHLGDKDEFLPTNHGFDEFYGNLYHLDAEDEPEHPDYPKNPAFRERFGPRGVIHSFADGRIEDTGPLTKKRMETIDDEVTERAIEFIKKAHAEGVPFFVWWNSTHMHVWTRIPKEAEGLSGQGFYNDAMVLHDRSVGKLLDLLDELGIAEDTIVQYSTDNGPRVPCFVRWPGVFEAGKVLNGIVTHQEWLPTLLAAAGEPDVVEKLKVGYQVGDKTFHVHIDGYNILPYLTGETDECPRNWFFYTNDDGGIVAIRYGDWKAVFAEQRAKTMKLWAEPFVELRMPKIFNLRRDPFERADDNANGYWNWFLEHVFVIYPMQALAAEQLQSFKEFPPRQKPGSFNLDRILEKTEEATSGGLR